LFANCKFYRFVKYFIEHVFILVNADEHFSILHNTVYLLFFCDLHHTLLF